MRHVLDGAGTSTVGRGTGHESRNLHPERRTGFRGPGTAAFTAGTLSPGRPKSLRRRDQVLPRFPLCPGTQLAPEQRCHPWQERLGVSAVVRNDRGVGQLPDRMIGRQRLGVEHIGGAALREYFPKTVGENWKPITAGQRVHVIKKDADKGGALQFSTEVITSEGGTIFGLLSASPGVSTATPILIGLLGRCVPKQFSGLESKLQEIIPSYGVKHTPVRIPPREFGPSSSVAQFP